MKESLEDILKEARKAEVEFRFRKFVKKLSRIAGLLLLFNFLGLTISIGGHSSNYWSDISAWFGIILFLAFISGILASIFAIIPHSERDYDQQVVIIFLVLGLVFLGLNAIISILLIGDLIVS